MGSGVMDNGMIEKSKKIRWKTDEYMKTVEKNGVTYLKYRSFEPFEKTIIHGFSTRLGGVSKGIYESMNLSFTRGDEEEAVFENYRRISEAIGGRYCVFGPDPYNECTKSWKGRQGKGNCKSTGLYGRRWFNHERPGNCACNFLCRLCALIFC